MEIDAYEKTKEILTLTKGMTTEEQMKHMRESGIKLVWESEYDYLKYQSEKMKRIEEIMKGRVGAWPELYKFK